MPTVKIQLPSPRVSGQLSLEEVIARRRSIRQFYGQELTNAEIAQLLWAAQGVTDVQQGLRTVPSAGAFYPLELYLAQSSGFYHFDAASHCLDQLSTDDFRSDMYKAAFNQDSILEASAVFVITATYVRTASKYGDRARLYAALEAGHAAQNMLLQAVSLNLGALPIGAFDEELLHKVLVVPENDRALYIIPVGHPR